MFDFVVAITGGREVWDIVPAFRELRCIQKTPNVNFPNKKCVYRQQT